MICAPAAARPAFRMGVRARNGRERSEDGADDHLSERQTRSLCGRSGWHSLPAATPHQEAALAGSSGSDLTKRPFSGPIFPCGLFSQRRLPTPEVYLRVEELLSCFERILKQDGWSIRNVIAQPRWEADFASPKLPFKSRRDR